MGRTTARTGRGRSVAGSDGALGGGHPELLEAELHVRARGAPRKQCELLEHGGGLGLPSTPLPLEVDAAGGARQKARDDPEQGGLPAAGRAEDGEELLRLGDQAHVVQGRHRVAVPAGVGLGETLHDDAHG